MNEDYPVRFSVEYPDRPLDRLTTALRIFTVIPIAIVLASIGGYTGGGSYDAGSDAPTIAIGGTGLLFLPPLLMIVFREKYPRWWFDWNLELMRDAQLEHRHPIEIDFVVLGLADRARRAEVVLLAQDLPEGSTVG